MSAMLARRLTPDRIEAEAKTLLEVLARAHRRLDNIERLAVVADRYKRTTTGRFTFVTDDDRAAAARLRQFILEETAA